MYLSVVFSEHCGLSPQAEIVAQLAAHVTRVSFVVLVLVLICFFSQTENLTRRSSDAYFHSVLLSQRKGKKKLLILPVPSTKGQASLSASDCKFWICCSDCCHTASVQHRAGASEAVSCVWELPHWHWLVLAATLSWESTWQRAS